MSKYITGQEILEHWEIKSFELFDYVKNGLKVYTRTGRDFDCPPKYNLKTKLDNIDNWIAKMEHPDFPKNLLDLDEERWAYERLTYDAPQIVLRQLKQTKIDIIKKLEIVEMKKDKKNRCSWYYCDLPDSEKEAEQVIDDIVNSSFLKEDVSEILGPAKKDAGKLSANTQKEKKLRSNQRHKIECRKIAAEIWNKDSSITIEDMVRKDEINLVSAPKIYGKKTLRNWIKDLCPNRTPGRRPKKS